jgi:Ca2+-binding RTX toxin-like protein
MPFNAQTIGTATLGSFTGSVFSDTFSVGNAEVDMIALDLVAGTRYEVDVDNGTTGDFYLRIFDRFGAEVRGLDDGFFANDDVVLPESPYLAFAVNYTGRYFVAISPWYLDAYDPFSIAGRNGGENPLAATAGTLRVKADVNFWPSASGIAFVASESSSDVTDVLTDADRSVRAEMTGAIDSLTDVDIGRIDLGKGDQLVIDVNGDLGGAVLGTVLRIFNAAGTALGFDDDGGFLLDPEFVFNAPSAGSFFVGISGEGNSSYNAVDGSGTVAAEAVGGYEVIIHRNPTQIGTSSSNLINGDSGANYTVGLGGNDTINGNDGYDTLAGGDDADVLNGGRGIDVIYGEHGADLIDGGRDNDMVLGGLGADNATGGSGSDVLFGGAADDTLFGGIGDGRDTLNGDAGNDSLEGDSGNDLLNGGGDNDTLHGEAGKDSLSGDSGSDSLFGGDGTDTLSGGLNNDTLFGGAGFDNVFGGDNDDEVFGEAGEDTLGGDGGNDTLTGGTSNDVFVFVSMTHGVDIITDFNAASPGEFIDLSVIFGATGSVVTSANLAQFVQITPVGAGADSFLGVDANGVTGGLSFTIIAQVNGVTSAELFDFANFLV